MLVGGKATVPFVLRDTVAVVRNVPAEICRGCHEPYLTGKVTDRVTMLLRQLRAIHSDVAILTYEIAPEPAVVLAEDRVEYDLD
jgi:YgiT-type zinc finger domain-containing protein